MRLCPSVPATVVLANVPCFATAASGGGKVAARSVEALWTAITRLIACFAPEECANYFRKSGYVPSA